MANFILARNPLPGWLKVGRRLSSLSFRFRMLFARVGMSIDAFACRIFKAWGLEMR
jgi:hypothetical protein